ncbi:MAG: EVE domain-containing protein [Planctomycetota bacterium]
MQYWLYKSEPGNWSWDDQMNAPKQTTEWDGVRNYQANNNMKLMKKGDRGFFYHSVKARTIVGVVEVVKEHEPDPTDTTGKGFGMVTLKAVGPVPDPVSLDEIKKESKLEGMVLVNNSRLSVQPVTASEWKVICKMGKFKI